MKSEEIRKCFLALVEKEGVCLVDYKDVIDIVKEEPKSIPFEIETCKELITDTDKIIDELALNIPLSVNILQNVFRKNIPHILRVYKLFIQFELEYLETKGLNTDKYLIELLHLLDCRNSFFVKCDDSEELKQSKEERDSIYNSILTKQTLEGTTPDELLGLLGIKPIDEE